MKLHYGDVTTMDGRKKADVITESNLPDVVGMLVGIIVTIITILIDRHLYKKGGEDAMNAENRACSSIGICDIPEKIYAKVLK